MFILLHVDASDPGALSQNLQNALGDGPANLIIATGNIDSIQALSGIAAPASLSQNWIGCSSCLGGASSLGLDQSKDQRLTLLALTDPAGSYGVASVVQQPGSIQQQAGETVLAAITAAGRQAELPALIWCMQAPGFEEQIIAGIQQVVGAQVPIFGGSAGDNDVSGQWCLFDGKQVHGQLMVIAVLYPSVPISQYFSSGYSHLATCGTVTGAATRRIISIDHQPAAAVYNRCRQQAGLLPVSTGNVLGQTTFNPMGRDILTDDLTFSVLTHPLEVHQDGSIELLSEIEVGDQLYVMQGSKMQLVNRAGHVARVAANMLRLQHDTTPAAAIVIYCAGCMLAVRDEIDQVRQSLMSAMPDTPFLMVFTFGEQGCFADGYNRHGNLMISTVLFGHTQQGPSL
jgi:hypothetical protein